MTFLKSGLHPLIEGVQARMQSAGGRYNFGNLLDLYSVAATAIIAQHPKGLSEFITTLHHQLAGDRSSGLFTAAAAIFFAGGEAYHQAWKNGFPPNKRANFTGDVLSGVGAVLLGAGLYGVGQPALAASSGALHAVSKFGSSLGISKTLSPYLNREFRIAGYVTTATDVLKDLAWVSRLPALVLCVKSITHTLGSQNWDQAITSSIAAMILTWCYVEFARADTILMQKGSIVRQLGHELSKKWDKIAVATPVFEYINTAIALAFKMPLNTQASVRAHTQNVDEVRRENARSVGSQLSFWMGVGLSLSLPKLHGASLLMAVPLLGGLALSVAKNARGMNHSRMQLTRLAQQTSLSAPRL